MGSYELDHDAVEGSVDDARDDPIFIPPNIEDDPLVADEIGSSKGRFDDPVPDPGSIAGADYALAMLV